MMVDRLAGEGTSGRLTPRMLGLQAATFAALILTSLYNYLLFHTLAEFYSIVIAFTYFTLAWNTRHINENPSIVALGIAYFFTAFLDIFHVLGYAGMSVFTDYPYSANQLWILARFLEAVSLLLFTFFKAGGDRKLRPLLGILGAYTALGLASIFIFRIFPDCYIEGLGQTPFKIAMELVIMILLAAAAVVLATRRRLYSRSIFLHLEGSVILTFLSEVPFTLYFSNFGWLNMVGHLLKIASYYLVYRSIVITGLERPQELLYSRLQAHEKELTRANEAQNTVIAILAHDLRGPIGAMANISSELAVNPDSFDEAKKREILEVIANTSANTLGLVERVLSWSQAMKGDLEAHFESVHLEDLCVQQARFLDETAKAKEIEIEVAVPKETAVHADREMLATIIRNLLHNAIKFSRRGEKVRIDARNVGGTTIIEVRDSGVGMSSEGIEKLFAPASRLRGIGTEGEKGTGLGVKLSRLFAEKMGGALEVSSAEGAGTTFTLRVSSVTNLSNTFPQPKAKAGR